MQIQLIKPSIILENTTFKQCRTYAKFEDRRCAIGSILENISGWELGEGSECSKFNGKYRCYGEIAHDMDKYFGSEQETFACPCCVEGGEARLGGVMMHLNDTHRLTFKEIAVWLRAIGH